jgi:hypothetical protein
VSNIYYKDAELEYETEMKGSAKRIEVEKRWVKTKR